MLKKPVLETCASFLHQILMRIRRNFCLFVPIVFCLENKYGDVGDTNLCGIELSCILFGATNLYNEILAQESMSDGQVDLC